MILRNHARGFALLELVIVLAILSVIAVAALNARVAQRDKAEQAKARTDYAEELRQLARATQEYVADQTWADGVVNTVTIAQLTGANLLPSSFGVRSLGAGRAPLGTTYSVRARRNAGAPPTIVVYESGLGSDAYASALGFVSASAPQTGAFRRDVANELRNDRFAAATIAAGTRLARGAGSAAWTKDLTDMIPAVLQSDSVAVLLGYLDLSGTVGNDPLPPGSFSGDCRVVLADTMCTVFGAPGSCAHPNAVWAERTCAASLGAGWTRLDTVTVCPPEGQASFRSTPVGTLTYATATQTTGPGVCVAGCASTAPCEAGHGVSWITNETRQTLRLNDQSVGSPLCYRNRDFNQYRDFSSGALICGYQTTNEPWGNPNVLASNPRHSLCCLSN